MIHANNVQDITLTSIVYFLSQKYILAKTKAEEKLKKVKETSLSTLCAHN